MVGPAARPPFAVAGRYTPLPNPVDTTPPNPRLGA